MFISKTKLLFAVLAMALIVPTTAFAAHSWPDVDDGRFYADAVEWAKANGMTTGCDSGANFCPERGVTRGENITFAKRYDDLVVQPALEEIEENIATVASDVNNSTRVHFARVESDGTVDKTGHSAISVTKAGTGLYTVTLPESAANCTVETALYVEHGGGFGGLINLNYWNEGLIWAAHDTSGPAAEIDVFTRYADDGATTDGDDLPDPFDLAFSVTAYCTDTFFIFNPGIIIPPIFIFP